MSCAASCFPPPPPQSTNRQSPLPPTHPSTNQKEFINHHPTPHSLRTPYRKATTAIVDSGTSLLVGPVDDVSRSHRWVGTTWVRGVGLCVWGGG